MKDPGAVNVLVRIVLGAFALGVGRQHELVTALVAAARVGEIHHRATTAAAGPNRQRARPVSDLARFRELSAAVSAAIHLRSTAA